VKRTQSFRGNGQALKSALPLRAFVSLLVLKTVTTVSLVIAWL
jgi:hypothetical protein